MEFFQVIEVNKLLAVRGSRLEPLQGGSTLSSRKFLVLYQPWKDERLSQTWSHPIALDSGPLDCESNALTIRSSLHNSSHPPSSRENPVNMCEFN